MDILESMKARAQQLRSDLRALENEIHEERIRRTNIRVGDIVRHARKGDIGRIVKIEPVGSVAWVSVNPRKKDGSFGTAVRNWYTDWKPEAVHNPVHPAGN